MSESSFWTDENDVTRALRVLGRVSLFRGLSEEVLQELAKDLREIRVRKGELLYTQGRRMHEAFYVLLSGRVRLLEKRPTGEPRILGYRQPREVLGVIHLLTGGPALATAEAVLDTVALALPFRSFHRILASHPAQALPLARYLGRRLEAWSGRRGRRSTRVFLGVQAPRVGPAESLLVLGLARSLVGRSGARVLVLDFDYGGALPRGGTPGVLRAAEEILDPRGHVSHELLRQRVLRADEALTYLVFHLSERDLGNLPEGFFAELLGEAKVLASYVLVRLPSREGPWNRDLRRQLDHLVLPFSSLQLEESQPDPELLGVDSLGAGFLGEEGESPPGPTRFLEATGCPRTFVFPWREVSRRSLLRLTPYPKEALEDGEEAMVQARAVIRGVTRRRLGVCLGSGTALGWAHVGVLDVLVREGVAVDALSASSMGAIIAAMFAMGMSPAEMEAEATRITEEVVTSLADYNWPVMRDGLFRGKRVEEYLRGLFGETRIEDLSLPLVIQATDLRDGSPHHFREGPLVPAVRASISLPGIFRPVEHEGRFLVDGGVRDTLPIAPLRAAGADLVLAVNTTQSPEFNVLDPDELRGYNVFHLFLRSLEIMQTRRTGYEAEAADMVIQPWIEGPNWRELWRAPEFIRFGREAAEKRLDDFLELLRSPP